MMLAFQKILYFCATKSLTFAPRYDPLYEGGMRSHPDTSVTKIFMSIKIFYHITARGCYIKNLKNKAECLYHTFITTLFNWSNFFC
jgi:hypothetical protein